MQKNNRMPLFIVLFRVNLLIPYQGCANFLWNSNKIAGKQTVFWNALSGAKFRCPKPQFRAFPADFRANQPKLAGFRYEPGCAMIPSRHA